MATNDIFGHRLDCGEHTYIFAYRRATAEDAIREVRRSAADPQLNFNWYDAADVIGAIQQEVFELK